MIVCNNKENISRILHSSIYVARCRLCPVVTELAKLAHNSIDDSGFYFFRLVAEREARERKRDRERGGGEKGREKINNRNRDTVRLRRRTAIKCKIQGYGRKRQGFLY